MARLVEKAEYEPAKCIVTGSWAEPEHPLIDFEAWAPSVDPRVYLSPGIVHDAAKDLLGMVDASEIEEARAEIEQLRADLAAVVEENDRLDTVVQAIDALESQDFRARKRAGRAKVKEAV